MFNNKFVSIKLEQESKSDEEPVTLPEPNRTEPFRKSEKPNK
jgi:hypothetical protein